MPEPECEDDARTAALWWRSKWDYTDLLSDLVEMKLALRMSGYISKSGKRTKKWDEEFDKLVENALDTQHSIIIRKFLNSPQFKEQSEEKIRKAIDDFREELVEEIEDGAKGCQGDQFEALYTHILHIIRTHGLEE